MEIKWLGINALQFRAPGVSFWIDPYVSRDREALHHPEEVDRYLTGSPSAVLMTHAHWDHLADMPRIIAKTDTILYASATACNIMRALNVPEKNLRTIAYGDELELPGGVSVRVIESRHLGHDEDAIGYDTPPAQELLAKADNWRCGQVFAFLIKYQGQSILNTGSANLYPPSMKGLECDTLICGISRWRPGFPELLQENLRFRTLIPTHHDEFKLPLDKFYLRDDFTRLKAAIPDLPGRELPILQWQPL